MPEMVWFKALDGEHVKVCVRDVGVSVGFGALDYARELERSAFRRERGGPQGVDQGEIVSRPRANIARAHDKRKSAIAALAIARGRGQLFERHRAEGVNRGDDDRAFAGQSQVCFRLPFEFECEALGRFKGLNGCSRLFVDSE